MNSFKNEITAEIANEIQSDCKERGSIINYEMPDFFSVRLGKVSIVKYPGGEVVMNLDSGAGREYMTQWNKGVGKTLCSDLKKKRFDLFFEYSNDNYKVLLRKVLDDEDFSGDDFDEVFIMTVGDFDYIIIRKVELDETYNAKHCSVEYENSDLFYIKEEHTTDDVEDIDSLILFE